MPVRVINDNVHSYTARIFSSVGRDRSGFGGEFKFVWTITAYITLRGSSMNVYCSGLNAAVTVGFHFG